MAKKKPTVTPETLLRLLDETAGSLDLSQLATDLLDAFGGTKGLAEKCLQHFEAATPTGKGKMLEAVMRLLAAATPKDADPLAAVGSAKTADIEKLLAGLMKKGAPAGE